MVTVEIVLLAMVAAFLGLRLYSVLGKRTGHEQEPVARPAIEERQPATVHQPVGQREASGSVPVIDSPLADSAAQSGLRAIGNADRTFDPALFLEGAKSAYGMILDAFWKGSQADYFKLYQYTANAIKDVDAQLRVGGPATADREP